MSEPPSRISLFLLAFGIALAGYFIGDGFFKGRADSPFVSVKGLSERDVKADMALWPIRFVVTDNNLSQAQAALKKDHRKILDFLEKYGLSNDNTEVQKLEVKDLMADPYRSGPVSSRFIITQTIMVRSDKPDPVWEASQNIGQLVESGVVLSPRGDWESGPTFLFTKLNDLKPEMIAEATAKAREAADQFAKDSGSDIGTIKRAYQGIFQILPRDRAPGVNESNQLYKTVRVVSSVDYFLED